MSKPVETFLFGNHLVVLNLVDLLGLRITQKTNLWEDNGSKVELKRKDPLSCEW